VCPSHSREVREGLIDGILFHLGGELPDHVEHPPGEETVRLVIGREDDEAGAKRFRLVERDTPFDAQPFGRVARAGDDPPLSPGDDGLPSQFGMDGLLAGGEEGIPVHMEDRPGPGIKAEDRLAHGITIGGISG